MLLHHLPLIAALAWAAAQDVRARCVPNWLTLSLALSGMAVSFAGFGFGAIAPGAAVMGMLMGLGIGFALFAIGAWAAGDAKLLAGIGAWLGVLLTLYVLAGALVIGMVIAVVQSVMSGRARVLVRDSALIGLELMRGARTGFREAVAVAPAANSPQLKARTIPLAVPLLLATVGVLLTRAIAGM